MIDVQFTEHVKRRSKDFVQFLKSKEEFSKEEEIVATEVLEAFHAFLEGRNILDDPNQTKIDFDESNH